MSWAVTRQSSLVPSRLHLPERTRLRAVRFLRLSDALEFRRHAERFLLSHEAEHGLILGLTRGIVRLPASSLAGLLVHGESSEPDGEVAGVALRLDARLLVSRVESDVGREALALALANEPCTAVLGATANVERVVSEMRRAVARRLEQGVYATRGVIWPAAAPPGRRRLALPADAETLIDWHVALSETIGQREEYEQARRSIARRLEQRALHVWEVDGRIVSSAAAVDPTPNGIRVNLVYTPEELRGRGYASSLVADLTDHLLQAGRDFVFLHTDLANPTSNRIYQRIGYERVGDFLMLGLADR
jgi:predicted GNAT family acetyltransferase